MSPVKSFSHPTLLRLEQQRRMVWIGIGDAHMGRASALMKARGGSANEYAEQLDDAAHHLMGAFGAFREAGLGGMADMVRRSREKTLRIANQVRAL